MTAATATDAAVTGVTEEQLVVLVGGRWQDSPDNGMPGWHRNLDGDGEIVYQWLFPAPAPDDPGVVRWNAKSGSPESGGEQVFVNSLDEALAWCDGRAAGRKPVKAASATKQEDRFARIAAAG